MSSNPAAQSLSAEFVNIDPYLENFAQRAQEGRDLRKLPAESMQDLRDSGYLRSMVPSQLGGLEITPSEFFRIQSKIAEYDMSTAWVGGIIAVHAFQIALMDEKAQQDVYGDDPNTGVSSSYNPVGGKTERAEGGLMLSGRWGWSSGSDHCDWVLLGAIIADEGYRTFLVPRSDYEIEDTWDTMGLRATGSNDIVIDKPVFVPDYRTHKQMDGFACKNEQPGHGYNLPWAQTFIRVVCTPAIGAAKHALKLFIENASTSSTDPTRLVGDPDVQRRICEAEHLIDVAETIMHRNFDAMEALLQASKEIPMELALHVIGVM